MATVLSHGLVAVTLGKAFYPETQPARFWAVAILCAAVPDADVIGYVLGVPYGAFWGHRGASHSLLFAAVWSAALAGLVAGERPLTRGWRRRALCLFLITASHGVLDALTDGGLGIALLSPFDNARYFFAWRPIEVSPIGFNFFSRRALTVLGSEAWCVGLPCLLLLGWMRWRRARPR